MYEDFIFVPHIQVITANACLFCTRQSIYVVLDEIRVDRGLLVETLSNNQLIETLNFEGKTPKEHIQDLLDAGATLEEMQSFFQNLQAKREKHVQIYEIEKMETLKVSAGWWIFPGSISAKMKGDMGYTLITSSIPKTHKHLVKEFYG